MLHTHTETLKAESLVFRAVDMQEECFLRLLWLNMALEVEI